MPKIGPMVLDELGLESVWIRGGYKGEVGPDPLHLREHNATRRLGSSGLKRDSRVSVLDHENPNCLPRSEMGDFAVAEEGSIFQFEDQQWTKMSAKEIEDIIHDRVFKVNTSCDDDPVTTPQPQTRRGHDKTKPKKNRKGSRR